MESYHNYTVKSSSKKNKFLKALVDWYLIKPELLEQHRTRFLKNNT